MKKREKTALKIAKEIAKELKRAKFTESMYVIGSLSTNHFDKFGDIDSVITTNKKINSKDVLPLLKRFMDREDYNKYSSLSEEKFPYRIDPKINRVKFTMIFLLEKWVLEDKIGYKKVQKHEYFKQADYVRAKKSIILFDKKNKIGKLFKKIPELPPHMRKYVLYERIHKLNYFLFLNDGAINVERKRKNIIETQYLIGDSINNLFECIYALNNKIMIDRKWAPKEIMGFKKKPSNLIKKLNKILKRGNSQKELNKKIKILRKITLELKRLVEKEGIKDLPELR